jgi:hypothetical protein
MKLTRTALFAAVIGVTLLSGCTQSDNVAPEPTPTSATPTPGAYLEVNRSDRVIDEDDVDTFYLESSTKAYFGVKAPNDCPPVLQNVQYNQTDSVANLVIALNDDPYADKTCSTTEAIYSFDVKVESTKLSEKTNVKLTSGGEEKLLSVAKD